MAHTPEVDVLAVQHDGELVNALAVRRDLDGFADDPVARLLVAWVESVDAGIDDSGPWVMPEQEPTPVTPIRRRGRAGLVAGVTAAVLVVSSGAAAAVTGDALAIVRAPIEVLGRVTPFVGGQDKTSDAKSGLPEPASPVAGPNKLLADAQRALAQGDAEEAARLLTQAQALLGDAANPGQQHRIDKLTAQLGADPKGKDVDQGKGKDVDQGKGKDVDQGKGKDVDQGKGKDVDQGKGKDVDQGTGTPQEPGTATSGNQAQQSTRAHGAEKPEEPSDATKAKSGGETAKSGGESKSGQQKT